MLSANEIRQQFVDFFVKKHGHTFVPSSSVVPLDDPTLMFTNAGMNQFKDVFLGTGTRPYRRAANSQKCIRVSGKHNDLEEVGRDTYHHTFFEMLGNWSFGDYYKKQAIAWAWELLTHEWEIDKSRLHATVFGGDQEFGLDADEDAFRLWTEVTDIDPSHVHHFGKKDNFWMMGETGPCGPCSEIHIDRTPDKSGGHLVNAGDPRVMEIWNLVFIQLDRDVTGRLTPLPAKHVDTGMGFERLTAILQGKNSNYDTDVFSPLMDALGQVTGRKYGGRLDDVTDVAFRVIADHTRMLTFALTDGALPSNKGRGSVMRGVLRRAVRYGWQCFDQREPFIYRLVPALVAHMGKAFPELSSNPARVAEVIRGEEADFLRTIERGLALFEDAAQRARGKSQSIRGKDIFDLHTTFGFPPDLTRQMAQERGLAVDEAAYQDLMGEHRSLSASDSFRSAETATITQRFEKDTNDRPKWDEDQISATFLSLIPAEQLGLEEEQGLVSDRTCFYAEAGGQVGDKGTITGPTGTFEVSNTVKRGNIIVHLGKGSQGRFEAGQPLQLKVAAERDFTRKNHTATHLLHWALQKVLGSHVEQRGSKVKPDEFTFDFSHSGPVTETEKSEVERLVNEKIYQDLSVEWRELSIEDAQRLPGVRAFFGDKYGDTVRVVEIGDGFSREFCGGTHLTHTGQAGFFKIVGEEGVAKGVRRLTCVTAKEAVNAVQREDVILRELVNRFRCQPEELPKRVDGLLEEVKKLQTQIKKGAVGDLQSAADQLLAQAEVVNGAKIIVGAMPPGPSEQMRQQVDRLRQKTATSVIVIGWAEDGKVQLLAAITEDLVKKGLHAGKMIGQVAKVVGGAGGGKPTMASAGGKDSTKIDEALSLAKKLAQDLLTQSV